MCKVTWRRFDRSAKQLVVGQTTTTIVTSTFTTPNHCLHPLVYSPHPSPTLFFAHLHCYQTHNRWLISHPQLRSCSPRLKTHERFNFPLSSVPTLYQIQSFSVPVLGDQNVALSLKSAIFLMESPSRVQNPLANTLSFLTNQISKTTSFFTVINNHNPYAYSKYITFVLVPFFKTAVNAFIIYANFTSATNA